MAFELGGVVSGLLAKIARLGTLSNPLNATLTGTSLQPVEGVSGALVDPSNNVLTVKYAAANVAASQTDSSIVAAVAAKRIRVLGYALSGGAQATSVTFNSKGAGAGTAVSMTHQMGANGVFAPGEAAHGHFQTASGEGLTVTTGAGSTTGIQVSYVEV